MVVAKGEGAGGGWGGRLGSADVGFYADNKVLLDSTGNYSQ